MFFSEVYLEVVSSHCENFFVDYYTYIAAMAPPAMVESPWCSPTCSVLFPIGIVFVILPLIWIVLSWVQIQFLKRHLNRLVEKRAWDELHTLHSPSSMTYGPWQGRASRLIEDRRTLIKNMSFQLGISLRFVLEEFASLYKEEANNVEWRLHDSCEVTESGFIVKVRDCCDVESGVVAWGDLDVCSPPENPNFYQLAGLLAYGPHALGKGQICPRDGRPDCSLVDYFQPCGRSGRATYFLSWCWKYDLNTMVSALAEFWRRFSTKTGAGVNDEFFLWWCFFVNNQFRLLQDGVQDQCISYTQQVQAINVFGTQLKNIGHGKLIICLDKLNESQHTVLEIYHAIQQDIKITLAVPPHALCIDDICRQVASLQDMFDFCSVDSAKAVSSNKVDHAVTEYIKDKILQDVGTFSHVDDTVQQFLVSEILQLLKSHNRASDVAVEFDQEDSRYFGVSLDFVLSEFKCLYRKKAPEAEWRLHDSCEVTESGFIVKVRDCCDVESGVVAWDDLDVCSPPESPNFYQLAGLVAYGPHALGKGQICPRDGHADCSLVDALHKENKSGQANWFLSWAWSYSLDVVCNALARWWDSHAAVVASEACPTGSVYLWWCFFVNNQFRMLEDGITQDTDSLLKVFAEPLQRAGKVLMCMDNFQNCTYTKRIWCIYEIFSAVRRNIPVTLIMPQLQLEQEIETLTEMVHACRVDAWQATASVKADEEKIKTKILRELKSFNYVNETVEKALWIEMIKMFKDRKDGASFRHSSSVFLDTQQIACVVSL